MFGRRTIPVSSHPTPEWAKALRDQYTPTTTLAWFPTRNRNWYGCAYIRTNHIELHCGPNENTCTRLLLLHEIGHILYPHKGPNPYRKGAPTYHCSQFWEIVAHLYAKHGCYDYAMFNEGYPGGRRYLRDHRARHVATPLIHT